MTSYGGNAITHDAIGNPITYYGWTINWKHGRQLASMTKNGVTWTYTYDANGLRTSRSNGTTTYKYVYNGDKLTQMTKGSIKLTFTYDAAGNPLTLTYNGTLYYYSTNLQGDVVGILDSSGATVVTYIYDAWGRPYSITGSLASTLGLDNPLRYRGYVYDNETWYYYLQSRYYIPEWGRFINADAFPSTGQSFTGNNMFAYCGNNPVSRVEIGGYLWDTVLDFVSLGFSIADVASNPKDPTAWLGVAADVASLLIPCVSGGGALVRAATKADDVVDIVKTVDKVDNTVDAVKTASKGSRSSAVRKAWKNEAELVKNTGKGSRAWTTNEINELLTNGKIKGYVGHHMKSVKGYPELSGDPFNIQFLTYKEHLLAHGGNWRNTTHGRYVP